MPCLRTILIQPNCPVQQRDTNPNLKKIAPVPRQIREEEGPSSEWPLDPSPIHPQPHPYVTMPEKQLLLLSIASHRHDQAMSFIQARKGEEGKAILDSRTNREIFKKMNEVGESPLTNGSPRPVSQNGPEHMNIGPRGSPPHRPLLGPSQSSQAIWPPVKGL